MEWYMRALKNTRFWQSATTKLPLIKGQVPVSKLCEQSPLQDLLGRLVLDEVDDNVLKSVVILR